MRKTALLLVAAATALSAFSAPALAQKGGNGNGNGKGNGNGGGTPVPAPAPAPVPVPAPTIPSCESTRGTVIANFTACYGFVAGNAFGGSQSRIDIQNLALDSLGSDLTIVKGGSTASATGWGDIDTVTSLTGAQGNFIDFGRELTGQKIIGIHFGNVAGPFQNVSGFWLIDFSNAVATTGITLQNTQGFSNAQLYDAFPAGGGAVPEPSAWALLILGFGTVGGAMRAARVRSRKLAASFA